MSGASPSFLSHRFLPPLEVDLREFLQRDRRGRRRGWLWYFRYILSPAECAGADLRLDALRFRQRNGFAVQAFSHFAIQAEAVMRTLPLE